VSRREDLIDPLWNELVSVVEDPWLAFDTGDPVNFFFTGERDE